MKGWVFVSIAVLMLVLGIASVYIRGGYDGAIFAAVGMLLAFMAIGEFSKLRRTDEDDVGEKQRDGRWPALRYGRYYELSGVRRRRRGRYGR